MPGVLITRELDPERWDRLAPGPAVQSGRWLSIMLSRLPGEPLVAYAGAPVDAPDAPDVPGAAHPPGDADAVGLVGAVVSDPDAYEAYNPWMILRRPDPVFEEVHAAGPPAPDLGDKPADLLPSLVLTAPGYVGDPVGPRAARPDAVRALLAGICDWARNERLATVTVLYTTPAGSAVIEPAVAALGGTSFPLTSRGLLPVSWHDWPGRLAVLPSSRRRKIQRQLRLLDEAGCTVSELDPRPVFDEVIEARCELLRWYHQPADEQAERRRLAALLDAFGPAALLFGTRQAGRLLACALFVAHDRTLQNVYAGTTAAGRDVPYAHLAAGYYAPARYASADRFSVIDYSVGHGDAKRFQGCEFVPMRGHVIGLHPA